MTSNKQGRHCESCNKTVIDFSLYTDKELVEFFEKANGKVCGNFMPYQLDRTILVVEQNKRTFFHKLFLGSALASWLGLLNNASAQTTTTTPQLTLQQDNSRKPTHALIKNGQESSCKLSGKVTDIQKAPMPGVEIQLFDSASQNVLETVYTDSAGYFTTPVPEKYIKKTVELQAYIFDYRTVFKTFKLEKDNYMDIELHRELMLRGEIKRQ